MDEEETPTKFDLQYAENKVRFSICDCSLDKKYSFWSLDRQQAMKFIARLRYIEKLKWKEFANLSRKNGVTPEKSGSPNFDLIHTQNTCESKLMEPYYFHFRVEQIGLFRVFGYQHKQFFYITHIDPNGKINH